MEPSPWTSPKRPNRIPLPRICVVSWGPQIYLWAGMGGRTTKVPRAPVCTRPRDPPLTGHPQLPQPPIGRPLRRSKDVRTHLPQLPLAGTPTNGERLRGLLCHMCSHKVTKAQTLWEVETAANTIQTMVLYLDGLHQTTSRLRGILCYPSNH